MQERERKNRLCYCLSESETCFSWWRFIDKLCTWNNANYSPIFNECLCRPIESIGIVLLNVKWFNYFKWKLNYILLRNTIFRNTINWSQSRSFSSLAQILRHTILTLDKHTKNCWKRCKSSKVFLTVKIKNIELALSSIRCWRSVRLGGSFSFARNHFKYNLRTIKVLLEKIKLHNRLKNIYPMKLMLWNVYRMVSIQTVHSICLLIDCDEICWGYTVFLTL